MVFTICMTARLGSRLPRSLWRCSSLNGRVGSGFATAAVGSFLGRLALFGWSVALFYHLCNGIRHLGWDAGYGFELKTAYASGYAVLVGTAVLTVLAWILAFSVMGRS